MLRLRKLVAPLAAGLAGGLVAAAPALADLPAAGFSPNVAYVGEPLTFVAEATDEDGIARYDWDLDDDGFDDATDPSQPTLTTTFTELGTFRVWLLVTDGRLPVPEQAYVYQDVVVTERPADPTPTPTPTPEPPERIDPFPIVRFAGELTDDGVRLRIVSVRASSGVAVRVTCKGTGCPKPRARVSTGGITRVRRFERAFKAGTELVVRATAPGKIGKHVALLVRSGKKPKRTDRCLWPGSRRPRPCP